MTPIPLVLEEEGENAVADRKSGDPTREEILERCEAIQAEWSETERIRRRVGDGSPAQLKSYRFCKCRRGGEDENGPPIMFSASASPSEWHLTEKRAKEICDHVRNICGDVFRDDFVHPSNFDARDSHHSTGT